MSFRTIPRPRRTPGASGQSDWPRAARWAAVWLLAISLLAGCSQGTTSTSGKQATSSSTPTSPISSAWTSVLGQIGADGSVSLSTALQAYALVFGALPGTQAPASSGGAIPSGTFAVRTIIQHFQDLTTAQQQAVLQRLDFSAPTSTQVTPTATAAAAGTIADPSSPVQRLTQPMAAPVAPTPVPTDAPGTADYRTMITALIPKFNAFLKMTYTLPTVLVIDPKTTADAYAAALDAQNGQVGAPTLCRIAFSPVVATYTPDVQQVVVAHELAHCYQAVLGGQLTTWVAAPGWIIEGSAEWMGEIVGSATPYMPNVAGFWSVWLSIPSLPLFSRAYSAVGFYALLDQAGISPWSVIPAMLASQANGANNTAGYQAAVQSAPQEVLDEWASSLERNTSLGLDWDLTGVGVPAASTYGGPQLLPVSLSDGQSSTVTATAYAATDYEITSQTDVVQVTISGTSRLIDDAHHERVTSSNGSYCTKQDGCTCPDGSPYQGPTPTQVSGVLHLAVTGGPQGATGAVVGMSLQTFCNQKKKITLPHLTVPTCQGLMSVNEANTLLQPPNAADTILPDNGDSGGSCNYVYGGNHIDLGIFFLAYNGPVPIPQSYIQAVLAKLAAHGGVTIDSATLVSGIGDQAEYYAVTAKSNGFTGIIHVFYVLEGDVFFDCFTLSEFGYGVQGTQAQLQQCATQVLRRLDP